jgi:hypothetical protein
MHESLKFDDAHACLDVVGMEKTELVGQQALALKQTKFTHLTDAVRRLANNANQPIRLRETRAE